MHLSASALAVAALTAVVSAGHQVHRGKHGPPAYYKGPSSSTLCYTMMGSQPAPYPILTSYTTTYTPCTSTVTATTTTTTTLVASTGTVTVTATSTVSAVSTSTVPAPATFLPVQTTLPEGTYSGAGGADPVGKRSLDTVLELGENGQSGGGLSGPRHPKHVICKKWAHQTKCTTTTTTVTSTSTVTPGPTFSTVTTTVTSTLFTSSTTVYAACATNNIIDGVVGQSAGQGFDNVLPATNNGEYGAIDQGPDTITTAYDCCVFGLLDPNGGEIFAFSAPNTCLIGAVGGQCPATGQASNLQTAITGPYTYIIGNLPCGEITAFL